MSSDTSEKGPLTFGDLAAIDVAVVKGVGPKRRDALEHFGIESVLDLLHTYPRRWIDRTNEARVADLVEGSEALVVVTVKSTSSRRISGGRQMVQVRTADDTGTLSLTFFNQPYQAKRLREGLVVSVFGKAERYRGVLQMTNPVVDLIGNRTGRVVPIYPQSKKSAITTWDLASWVASALQRCVERGLADPVPVEVRERLGFPGRLEAFRAIHAPDTLAERDLARRRLAFDEVFRIQARLVARKRAIERSARGICHVAEGPLVAAFADSLPYSPTSAQRRVIDDIVADMASPRPMHRLLQGDVGSGKTLVALWAMLTAVQGGHQGALMAPTEVLAEQHWANIAALVEGLTVSSESNLFGSRSVRVALLTNGVGAEARRSALAGIASGEVDIAIGTHALIQEAVGFARLGLVVVDEQHRFGVEQRAALRERAGDDKVPDVLSMTATPIPRSAALTVYGDLDVSVIDEMPPGRTPILTSWVPRGEAEGEMWREVRARVDLGEQCYVVCPLIEESDKTEGASAVKVRDGLAKGELAGRSVAVLHGRMTPTDKDAAMAGFRAGDTQVLVATTVIEVGVDVPNATMMVVLDADRFGIAQLHQLRGRVGRGSLASRCWLVTEGNEPGSRVEALVASTDGFALAEVDLALRGEGTLMDAEQKGRSDLRLASLQRDLDLIQEARQAALAIVDADPDLAAHRPLADEIRTWFSDEDAGYLSMG